MLVEDVFDFRAGEIGVDDEAGFLAELVFEAAFLEFVADARGDAALPHDGVLDGLAGFSVPEDNRLALVRDADGGDVFRARLRLPDGGAGRGELRPPDGLGFVLDMAGGGKYQ